MNELRWSGFSIMLVSSILPLVIAVVFYYFGNWIGVKFYNTPFTGILNFWQIILIPLFSSWCDRRNGEFNEGKGGGSQK